MNVSAWTVHEKRERLEGPLPSVSVGKVEGQLNLLWVSQSHGHQFSANQNKWIRVLSSSRQSSARGADSVAPTVSVVAVVGYRVNVSSPGGSTSSENRTVGSSMRRRSSVSYYYCRCAYKNTTRLLLLFFLHGWVDGWWV